MSDCTHDDISSVGDCMNCGAFIPWYDRKGNALTSRLLPKPAPPGAREWHLVLMAGSTIAQLVPEMHPQAVHVLEATPETLAAGEMRAMLVTACEELNLAIARFAGPNAEYYAEQAQSGLDEMRELLTRIAKEETK